MCVCARARACVCVCVLNNNILTQTGAEGRHMVKNHSVSERGNPLPPHRLLFPISRRVLLYASSHRQDNTSALVLHTSHGALAGTSNSSMGPP